MQGSHSTRTRWFTLIALTSINILNYIDRNIISALVPAIQGDLHFSDTQMGLLASGFTFAYTIVAPVFGAIGDRGPRLKTMASGVLLWSGATAWSGIAGSFATQMAARVTVGLGEAGYSVIAPSVIADYFSKAQRGRVFAIYSCAIPVGSALGYVLGGILEPLVGWRQSFFVVGIPGIVIALLLFLMKDPPRGQREENFVAAKAPVSTRKAYGRLLVNGSYMYTVLGYAAFTFVVGGLAFWMPTYIVRYFEGVTLERGNLTFGGVTVVGGFFGTFLGGWLADRIEVRSGNGYMKVSVLSMAIAAPLFAYLLTIRDFQTFSIVLFFMEVALFMCISPLDAAVVNAVKPDLRATAMALNIFLIHALGDGISRPLMGKMSDLYGLQYATTLLPWMLAFAGVLWAWGLIAHYHPMTWPTGALAIPRFQAHRGYRPNGDVRENTIPAFRLAKSAGAEMVECDVQVSRDGEVVIFHDENLARIVGSNERVTELSADELGKKVQAPRLEELLSDSACPSLVNIEIKSSEARGHSGVEAKAVEVVRRAGAENRVLFSSFNPFVLRRLSKIAPEIPRALLVTEEANPKNKIYLRRMWFGFLARPHIVHFDKAMLTPARLERWTDRGLPIAAWTVNEAAESARLEAGGVKSIITDKLFANR
ncbi:MAG: MFS transporter [Bdellovibrionota bacterium]